MLIELLQNETEWSDVSEYITDIHKVRWDNHRPYQRPYFRLYLTINNEDLLDTIVPTRDHVFVYDDNGGYLYNGIVFGVKLCPTI